MAAILTNSEVERFVILAEEAGEVVQICMKILRHGPYSYHPEDSEKTPNKELLRKELADLISIAQEMAWYGDIQYPSKEQIDYAKVKRQNYTYYQIDSKLKQ